MPKTQFDMLGLVLVSSVRLHKIKAAPFNMHIAEGLQVDITLTLKRDKFLHKKRLKGNSADLCSRESAVLQLQSFFVDRVQYTVATATMTAMSITGTTTATTTTDKPSYKRKM